MFNVNWKTELLNKKGRHLLPQYLPLEILIFLCRNMALNNNGELSFDEINDLADFLTDWIEKILAEQQDAEHVGLYKKHADKLLPLLFVEIWRLATSEIISRQIGYQVKIEYLAKIFSRQFQSVAESEKNCSHQ